MAYDIMEADGQDVRPEPLEERRKLLGEAAVPQDQGDAKRHPNQRGNHRRWGHIFRHACWMDLEGIVSKRIGYSRSGRAILLPSF